jgi:glycosyltransferase involved in cell wall biosynthesis
MPSPNGFRNGGRMVDRPLSIMQVSTADVLGGAERIAWNLFETYRARGHESYLAVGRKSSHDSAVLRIANDVARGPWGRFWWGLHHRMQPRYADSFFARRVCKAAHRLAEPGGFFDARRGLEDFRFPGTRRLLDLPPRPPDVVHCHNLHGKYFDLRALPELSRRVPVILTLHDAWLLAGHCAHSFDCERWRAGCGHCPDLAIYPPIRRDATAFNWQRKRAIFAASRLYVATPCRWLMSKVERSMLAPAVVEGRVIPNGVDLAVFKPADKAAVRRAIGLPADASILLFSGYGVRKNPWKDYDTIHAAVRQIAQRRAGHAVLFIALGEAGPTQRVAGAEMRFVPFDTDAKAVAQYCQAADIYVHAARADTFPNSVLEALACGTPVVATATGGIPEQIKPRPLSKQLGYAAAACEDGSATGVLVPQCDASALAVEIEHLLNDDALRLRMADNAAADARSRFDVQRQADAYHDWYTEILDLRSHPNAISDNA